MKVIHNPVCQTISSLLQRIGDKWSVLVVSTLGAGPRRFNELKQAVGEIPPRTLAQRLVELERAGLLERQVIDARPPRVEYRLTTDGLRLRAVLDALAAYAAA